MKSYNENYIDLINQGLTKSIFHENQKKISAEFFFDSVNQFLKSVQRHNGRIFFFGNGASAAFSNHMSLDWSKNGGILSLCLSDSSMLTALANDYDYDHCFLEFLKINMPTENDIIITTSSSGNSPNVVNVLSYCKSKNIKTLALSGLNLENKSMKIADYSLFVPLKTYGMVECIHQVFHHLILDKFMNVEEWSKKESQNMDAKNFKL